MELVAIDGVPEVVEHPVVPKLGRFFAVVGAHLKNPARRKTAGGLLRTYIRRKQYADKSAYWTALGMVSSLLANTSHLGTRRGFVWVREKSTNRNHSLTWDLVRGKNEKKKTRESKPAAAKHQRYVQLSMGILRLPHEILGDLQHRILVRAPDVVDVALHAGVEDHLERARYVGNVEKISGIFS